MSDAGDRCWNCGVVPKRWLDITYPGLDEQRLLCSNCFARTTRQPVVYGWATSSSDWDDDDADDELPQGPRSPPLSGRRVERRVNIAIADSCRSGGVSSLDRCLTFAEIPERRRPRRADAAALARLRSLEDATCCTNDVAP
jgi:hypothetical protein